MKLLLAEDDKKAAAYLKREFQLLEYLMRHASRLVTRTMLLESVWDFHSVSESVSKDSKP